MGRQIDEPAFVRLHPAGRSDIELDRLNGITEFTLDTDAPATARVRRLE